MTCTLLTFIKNINVIVQGGGLRTTGSKNNKIKKFILGPKNNTFFSEKIGKKVNLFLYRVQGPL